MKEATKKKVIIGAVIAAAVGLLYVLACKLFVPEEYDDEILTDDDFLEVEDDLEFFDDEGGD